MGNCGCLSNANKEDNNELPLNRSHMSINIAESYKQVVKIQAAYRGYTARKAYYEVRMQNYNIRVLESLKQLAATYFSVKFKHLQPFTYDYEEDNQDPLFEQRVFRPVHHFQAGGTYLGEWY